VAACRQEENLRGVCLNGTHPYTLPLVAEPVLLQTVDAESTVRVRSGQCYEGTIVPRQHYLKKTKQFRANAQSARHIQVVRETRHDRRITRRTYAASLTPVFASSTLAV
jgi:hypothetical protein